VPRGGFQSDFDVPPEKEWPAGSVQVNAASMGPAPWIPSLSPHRRSPTRRPNALEEASAAPTGGFGAAGAAARLRARGNVRLRPLNAVGSIDGAAASACGGGETWPQPADEPPPPVQSPPAVHNAEPAVAVGASQATVQFAPKAKAAAVPKPKVGEKATAKKGAGGAPTAPEIPAELVLAERARERVRARREQRARSEAPPAS
jgi:hypothetical protein